jgi:peptidoglycan/LPS O-acetylase OafA/YrhL
MHQVVAFTMFFYFPSRLIFRALRKLFGVTLTFNLYGTKEFFVFGAITLTLATISYRYFEVPIMRYRDRRIAAS